MSKAGTQGTEEQVCRSKSSQKDSAVQRLHIKGQTWEWSVYIVSKAIEGYSGEGLRARTAVSKGQGHDSWAKGWPVAKGPGRARKEGQQEPQGEVPASSMRYGHRS